MSEENTITLRTRIKEFFKKFDLCFDYSIKLCGWTLIGSILYASVYGVPTKVFRDIDMYQIGEALSTTADKVDVLAMKLDKLKK